MFCCLYQFAHQSRIPGGNNVRQDCTADCPHFKDNMCSIMSIKNRKLDDEKFGSILERTIVFPDDFPKYYGLTLKSAVLIIHPRNEDMWVMKGIKADGSVVYKYVMAGGRFRDAKTLDEVYSKIQAWISKPLTDNDFELCNSNARPV